MFYYSTNNRSLKYSFSDAVLKGLTPDGGLFMPSEIPALSANFIADLENQSFSETSYQIAKSFTDDKISNSDLVKIIESAISFPAPLARLNDNLRVLELFHGPTLAFKDFGARFMARVMSYLVTKSGKTLNILVATSGDTGSAVANGFLSVDGINVFVLYPSGKVSNIQEKQLTTYGNNITAIEVDGTFDDCQKMVKQAFSDNELGSKINLSSANSINIARLIPQSFYYFEAYKQIINKNNKILFIVPSGNLGNLTAGLFAKKMGLPINEFLAATNKNKVFTEFIETGIFNSRASIQTYSNAMDVGNPSNHARIVDLYNNNISSIRNDIKSYFITDEQTLEGIREVNDKYNYTIDPHGAVGYIALNEYYKLNGEDGISAVILETAHPSKFPEVVELATGRKPNIHSALRTALAKEKQSIKLGNSYSELTELLHELHI